MNLRPWLCSVGLTLSLCASAQAADEMEPLDSLDRQAGMVSQVIVQIGGRFCEYHRDEVEGALRRYSAVHSVEFLNDHGTVLIRYRTDRIHPAQLAESAAQAAFGMGCKAWVDRGGQGEAKS